MSFSTILRMADSEGSGGGEGEGVAGGEAPKPTPFSWETPLPKELPDSIKSLSGKTLNDLVKSHSGALKRATKAEQELAKINAKSQQAEQPHFVTAFSGLAQQYVEAGGELDEQAINEFVEQHKVPAEAVDMIHDFLSYTEARNRQFSDKAQAALGDDVQFRDIQIWLKSGESPFTAEEVTGFNRLANSGMTGWLSDVKEAFGQAAQENPALMTGKPGKPAAPKIGTKPNVPARRARPISDTGTTEGYATHADYMKALADARASGNYPAIQAVHTKMMQTPQHVRVGW